ncbi:MAG: FAD-binding and (Fe-S)-binding domain-containing protein [Solirubrobacteraceae bacterium]
MAIATRGPAALRGTRRRVKPPPPGVDLGGLKAELERGVAGEVRFDPGTRALYANDFSLYRHVPIGLVIPRDADDVEAAVAACRHHGAPILPRGCGTGPSGQTVNVAVIIDFSKAMNRIVELDPDARRARVQPGVICDQLRNAAEEHGLTYGPDPATREYCTFGGMLGNNSCGTHSLMAGKTSDNTEELDVVLYDGTRLRVGQTSEEELQAIVREGGRRGEIYAGLRDIRDRYADLVRERFPDIPRRVSGYNLDQLLPENGFHVARALVGTEGTCGTIVEATVRLVPSPPERITLLLAYPDVASAGDHVPAVLEHGPIGLEGFDAVLTENMEAKRRLVREREALSDGKAWLLAEFGAWSREEAEERARRAAEALRDGPAHDTRVLGESESQAAWAVRSSAVGHSRTPGQFESEGNWEDAAVHPDVLGDYLRAFGRLLDDHGYRCIYYGHFSQGCVHTRIDFDLKTAEGVRRFRSFMEEATDLVVAHGGSIAGEYGEGQGRAELLPRMFGPELVQAFREFKAVWDPDRKMNPGKVVDAYRLDENLRLGPEHRPPHLETHFAFPQDGGSFAAAAERCFGMAKCRTVGDGAIMCPSFQVTREERHTTRGRARLLFEMLKGEVVPDGWRDEAVKESLDFCLACKGCKAECPVQVDMATYKAEFLSHYYARRLRPRAAYAMGLIPWWARLACRAPRAVNLLTRTRLAKAAAGIHPERRPPSLARQTFRGWFAARRPPPGDGAEVVLWPDTFNDFFRPEVARAAVEVIEATGHRVRVPERAFCCGRPLYEHGMLPLAKRLLRRALDALEDDIAAGTPVVVLEPSCAAVFRDELPSMLPHDEHARRLSEQALLLSEFLERHAPDWRPPKLERQALVHGHCHHRAVLGFEAETRVLERVGLDAELLDAGCCGMAGSFGYEKRNYDLSMACGEQKLLPRARELDPDALLVADGFSCQEQVAQATGKRALHLAEVLRMTLDRRLGQAPGSA